jgi:signal transduction histidine kinase
VKLIRERIGKYLSLIGPWPIEPFYLGFLTFFMVASLYSLDEGPSHSHSLAEVFLRPVFSTVIALLTMAQLKVAVRVFKSYEKRIAVYLAILLVQSFSIWSWIVLFRYLFPVIQASFTAFLSPLPLIRFLFTLLCINGFIGLSRAKLTSALEEKEFALRTVENQRNQLLEYDESTRARFSEFLHDRVQSSLVTACLELQEIQKDSSGKTALDISRVIENLENLRSVEVRNASQTLSPAIGNADLYTSINLMAQSYAPQIKLNFPYSSEVERMQASASRELLLGIYRITEQAFLNSHIHGNAKNFEISISIASDFLTLTIENDGAPIRSNSPKGLGTAIINSWVRTLNGTWSIENRESGRVVLEAVLPL